MYIYDTCSNLRQSLSSTDKISLPLSSFQEQLADARGSEAAFK